jgi:GAF domain
VAVPRHGRLFTVPEAIAELALRMAAVPATSMDLGRHLAEVCDGVVASLRVPAAAVVVLDPPVVHGSDAAAVIVGKAQRDGSVGPVTDALRSGRPMLVPDLTRIGEPALAAVAGGCGLVSIGVVPLGTTAGDVVGAVQLLGTRECPVTTSHLDRLAPLVQVVAAQIVDVATIARCTGVTGRVEPARPAEVAHRVAPSQPILLTEPIRLAEPPLRPRQTRPTDRAGYPVEVAPPEPNRPKYSTRPAAAAPAPPESTPYQGRRRAPEAVPAAMQSTETEQLATVPRQASVATRRSSTTTARHRTNS